VDDLAFASICWQDGEIDPHSVMQTYVQRARQRGVEINEQVEATGIQIAKGRVVGVQTKAGLIVASTVINAAGARAAQVASWVGVNLPIKNFKRTIFITDRFDEIPASMPFVMDLSVEWYFRKERQGILLGMGTEESTAFEPKFEWDYLTTITQHALHRAPILAQARVMRGCAGLRSLTPDDYPILGQVPQVEGFINCCGWGGHGVMHAPMAGKLVAELVADGQATTLGIEPFALSRFGSNSG
jgi:sarcosine oxidase subunit beta